MRSASAKESGARLAMPRLPSHCCHWAIASSLSPDEPCRNTTTGTLACAVAGASFSGPRQGLAPVALAGRSNCAPAITPCAEASVCTVARPATAPSGAGAGACAWAHAALMASSADRDGANLVFIAKLLDLGTGGAARPLPEQRPPGFGLNGVEAAARRPFDPRHGLE